MRDGLLASQKLPAASVPANVVRSRPPDLAGLAVERRRAVGAVAAAADAGDFHAGHRRRGDPQGHGRDNHPGVPAGSCSRLPHRRASEVAVFDTYSSKSLDVQETCSVSHQVQATGAVHTTVVLPRVEVLSVGPAPASGQGTSSGSTGAFGWVSQFGAVAGGGAGDAGRPAGRRRAAHPARRGRIALPGAAHAHLPDQVRHRARVPVPALKPGVNRAHSLRARPQAPGN